MTFPADLLAAAERLSPAARRFLERVETEPDLLRWETFAPLLAACREVIPTLLVWGPFVFGDDYGGLFVRLLPTDRGPVVNTGRGAVLGLAFEVPGA